MALFYNWRKQLFSVILLCTLFPSVLCVLHRQAPSRWENSRIFNIPILWDTEQMVRNHLSMGKWKLCLPKDSTPLLCCKHLAMPLRRKVSQKSRCLCFKVNVSRANSVQFFFFFSPKDRHIFKRTKLKISIRKLITIIIYVIALNLEKQNSIMLLWDKGGGGKQTSTQNGGQCLPTTGILLG